MRFSEKPQVEQSDNKKWVIHGIALRASLKPIYTIPMEKEEREEGDTEEEFSTTTPIGEEARVPTMFTCPPAPKKRKPSLKCNYLGGGAREFFNPPDLETVFIRQTERAK